MPVVHDVDDVRSGPITAPPVLVVVDDQADTRMLVRLCFQAKDWEVIELDAGDKVVETCRTHHPDLVLLDVQMPGMDGWEVLRRLKADDELATIPVVLLTVKDGTTDVVRGLELGAHDYVTKPFEPAELAARAHAALHLKRRHDQLGERNAQLYTASRTDPLTGLPNRRQMEEELHRLRAATRRHPQRLAAVMVDLDHFKQVNDAGGHAAGDAVLREVATRLRATLRTEELGGRWGGDEFLFLLPQASAREAWTLAERVRAVIGGSPVLLDEDRQLSVTVSAGYAVGAVDPERLVRQADLALYAAKKAGRNRVCGYGRRRRSPG